MVLSGRKLILASQSPRRKELLAKMGLVFEVIPSDYDEQLDHSRHVEKVAVELALGKARAVVKQHPKAVVIGSDTIVFINGTQLGKPKDENDARHTLRQLAGKVNVVSTGLAVVCEELNLVITEVVSSKVFFKAYHRDTHEAYLASGDWHDKAGSYGIQSGAAPLISRIGGDYDSVLGLPTKTLAAILRPLGFICGPVELVPPVPVQQLP
ncbi:MAG TPA: Maf family protein [Candidatus Saccharimonadales bacterium]|nr:Maf family protein [Candidatus Saccharimonadales bacterium]